MSDMITSLFTFVGAAAIAATVAVYSVKLMADKYVGKYLEVKGLNLANKEDIKTLRELVEMNTTVAKSIEQTLNINYTLWQSRVAFMQRQLDEFYYPLRARLTSQTQLDELWAGGELPDTDDEDAIDKQMRQIDQDNYNLCLAIIYDHSSLIQGDKESAEFIQFVTGVKIFNLYTSVGPSYCVPPELEESPAYKNLEKVLLRRLHDDIAEIEGELKQSKAPRPLAQAA